MLCDVMCLGLQHIIHPLFVVCVLLRAGHSTREDSESAARGREEKGGRARVA